MNIKHIYIVFEKEMKDAFRDKKSVITNILLPLFLIPIMYFCMSFVMNNANKDLDENFKISVLTNESMELAKEFTKTNIIGDNKIEIVEHDEESAKDALKEGDINCIIIYADGFFENLEQGIVTDIVIEYNSLKNSSNLGMQRLQVNLMALNQRLATEKLLAMDINDEILNLVNITTKDASVEFNDGKTANEMLMMIIPMYLAITIVTAGIPIAIDVISGERERNTFESLLSTKANRLSILIGKYMAVLVFSVLAIIMSFIGLIIGIVMNPEMFSSSAEKMSINDVFATMNMPIESLVLAILSTITLAIVFAGIQIAISSWAKSVKEAQTYLSYMTFPVIIIGMATMFMGAGDIELYMSFIPVFNTISSLKMVFSGVIDYSFLGLGIITNIVFVIMVTSLMVKMFNNEKNLIK